MRPGEGTCSASADAGEGDKVCKAMRHYSGFRYPVMQSGPLQCLCCTTRSGSHRWDIPRA